MGVGAGRNVSGSGAGVVAQRSDFGVPPSRRRDVLSASVMGSLGKTQSGEVRTRVCAPVS